MTFLEDMTAQDVLLLEDCGSEPVRVISDSGHSVIVQSHSLNPDGFRVWVDVCPSCGSLGVHRHLLRAIRQAQDH